jgi:hypothetical protein
LRKVRRRLRVPVQRVRERNGIGGRLKTLLTKDSLRMAKAPLGRAHASLGIADASLGETHVGETHASLGIAEVSLGIKVTLRIKHAGLRLDWMYDYQLPAQRIDGDSIAVAT